MRFVTISLNIALLCAAMWAIVSNYGGFALEGMVIVSIMTTSAVISLTYLYVFCQQSTESDRVKSLKEAIKEAELEKQLRDLQEGNK